MPEKYVLEQYRHLPLGAKVIMTKNRIREWYNYWGGDVYISYSGGKDSTVLVHLVHDLYPEVPLVFVNTGLEFPEIQAFARKMGAEFIRPKMRFDEVISTYGYPLISKENANVVEYARTIKNGSRTSKTGQKAAEGGFKDWRRKALLGSDGFGKDSWFCKAKYLPLAQETQFRISPKCCDVMKKGPMKNYQKQSHNYPILGTMTEESKMRERAWMKNGCNAFDAQVKTSQPMSFWTEQDVLQYIKQEGIEIASVYGDILACDENGDFYEPMCGMDCKLKCTGCNRTGCIFCGFGIHMEKGETRFQMLARTHPRQYEYCMRGGQWVDNSRYDPAAPKMDGTWENWNPRKIWVPSKEGLGMKKVFDDINAIYGKDFIRYE